MKRRMHIEVEREADGLGYHAAVWDLDGRPHRVPGWEVTRLGAWRSAWRFRRRLEAKETPVTPSRDTS